MNRWLILSWQSGDRHWLSALPQPMTDRFAVELADKVHGIWNGEARVRLVALAMPPHVNTRRLASAQVTSHGVARGPLLASALGGSDEQVIEVLFDKPATAGHINAGRSGERSTT